MPTSKKFTATLNPVPQFVGNLFPFPSHLTDASEREDRAANVEQHRLVARIAVHQIVELRAGGLRHVVAPIEQQAADYQTDDPGDFVHRFDLYLD